MKVVWAVGSFTTLWLIPMFLGFKIYDSQFDDYTLFMSLFWFYRPEDSFYRWIAIAAIALPLLASLWFALLSRKSDAASE